MRKRLIANFSVLIMLLSATTIFAANDMCVDYNNRTDPNYVTVGVNRLENSGNKYKYRITVVSYIPKETQIIKFKLGTNYDPPVDILSKREDLLTARIGRRGNYSFEVESYMSITAKNVSVTLHVCE